MQIITERIREVEQHGGSASVFFVASHCRSGHQVVDELRAVGLSYGAIAKECLTQSNAALNALRPGRYPEMFAEAFEIAKRNKPAPRECAARGGA